MGERGLGWAGLWVCAAMLLAGGAQAAGKCERLVATGNPEYPPYLWRDPQNPEKLIGATVDLLKAVAEDLGVGIEVIYAGPWSRAQEEAVSYTHLTLPTTPYV